MHGNILNDGVGDLDFGFVKSSNLDFVDFWFVLAPNQLLYIIFTAHESITA